MKKLQQYFIFFLFINPLIISQVKVQIVVSTNKIGPDEKIFIAGNNSELGNWNPGLISLVKVNDSTWIKDFFFDKGSIIEFKLTKGSWNNEALNAEGKAPDNTIIKVSQDTSIIFRISNWNDLHQNVFGQITGQVRYHSNFHGKNILPRDIIVWLPPSYDLLSYKHYPVFYMQDGQNIFDPATSSFGKDWQIDETADSLIKEKAIDEIIIVGIYNSIQRSSEYENNDTGYAYMKFIINELKPFIDRTYRTLPDKNNSAVGGSSLGALISFMLVWDYPDIFSKAACLSPAFKISDIDFVKTVRNYNGTKKAIKIYIDNGGVGLEKSLQPGADEMLSALKDKGYVEGKDVYWFSDEKAEHNETAWAKRVYRFLEFLFPYSD